jgi:hypothetical protein
MNSFNIYEAYAAVYNEELRDELSFSLEEDFDAISELSDDELEEIVEDSIFDFIEEGYEIEDVEDIFEEVLSEARVDMSARAKRRQEFTAASEKSAKEARGRGAAKERADKRAATVQRVKSAVSKTVSDVKSTVKKTAGDIKAKAKEAKFQAVDAPAAKYASGRGIGGPAPGMQARAKDPAKRRALRGAVLRDIGSRAKAKLGRGVEKARAAGERAVGAVKSSSDTAQSKMRAAGSEVKKGAKGLLGGAARAVSRGARDVARRLGEDVDLYDLVLEHLLDEGYADTEDAATVIMANMSEEWREEILEVTGGGKVEYKPTFRGPSGRPGGRISPQGNQDPQHRGMSSYPGHKTADKIDQLNYEKSKTPKASEKRKKLKTRLDKLQTRFDRDGKEYQDYV